MQNKISDNGLHLPDPSKWIDYYYNHLMAFGLSRINDTELVKDLVQETFLAALENLESFQGRSTEKTWLTAILKNKICLTFRKQKNNRVLLWMSLTPATIGVNDETDSFYHYAQSPHNVPCGIQQDVLHNALRIAVNSLPAAWRRVFVMRYVEGRPAAIICEELKITPANYWIICHRLKGTLKASIKKTCF